MHIYTFADLTRFIQTNPINKTRVRVVTNNIRSDLFFCKNYQIRSYSENLCPQDLWRWQEQLQEFHEAFFVSLFFFFLFCFVFFRLIVRENVKDSDPNKEMWGFCLIGWIFKKEIKFVLFISGFGYRETMCQLFFPFYFPLYQSN